VINVLLHSKEEICCMWSVAQKIIENEKVPLSTPCNIKREWGITPLIQNTGTKWKRGASLTLQPIYPRKEPTVTTALENGLDPDPVWTL
jgi:hypothetical protein